MTGDGVTSLWRLICRVAWSSWVELVTCGACNTSIHQIADVFAKKIGGNPPKQQKPRLNQTTYTVHAPSSIERLLRSEQVAVEPYRAASSRFRCLARPDCMFFTSIWFEVDGGFLIYDRWWCRFDIGLAESVDWVRFCYVIRSHMEVQTWLQSTNADEVLFPRRGGWVVVAALVVCNVCEGHQMVLAKRVAGMHLQFSFCFLIRRSHSIWSL